MRHYSCVIKAINLFTMRLRKPIVLLITVLAVITGCKKENGNSIVKTPPDDTTCTTSTGYRNGDIIEGKYIVAYKTDAVQARGMSVERLDQITGDILSRNNISA